MYIAILTGVQKDVLESYFAKKMYCQDDVSRWYQDKDHLYANCLFYILSSL